MSETTATKKLLPFDDTEAQKVIRASRSSKSRLFVSDAIRQRILRAIVLIHNQARYFEGMAILCSIAGMKRRILENEFDDYDEQIRTRKQFNDWIRRTTGVGQ